MNSDLQLLSVNSGSDNLMYVLIVMTNAKQLTSSIHACVSPCVTTHNGRVLESINHCLESTVVVTVCSLWEG